MRYELSICPRCLEQTYDEGSHEHGGVYYCPVEVTFDVDLSMEDRIRLADAKLEAERAHDEAEAKAALDRAELKAIEDEWRATAPKEQIEAYDGEWRTNYIAPGALAVMLDHVWRGEITRLQLSGPNPIFAAPEDVAAQEAKIQQAREREARDTIARFEAEGPAAVPFWKLRDARKVLGA